MIGFYSEFYPAMNCSLHMCGLYRILTNFVILLFIVDRMEVMDFINFFGKSLIFCYHNISLPKYLKYYIVNVSISSIPFFFKNVYSGRHIINMLFI